MGDRMYATARVLQRPHPLSRHKKRGDQHSSLILRAPGPDGRRGSSPIGGADAVRGKPAILREGNGAAGGGRVAGAAMREGARRETERS